MSLAGQHVVVRRIFRPVLIAVDVVLSWNGWIYCVVNFLVVVKKDSGCCLWHPLPDDRH